jgi:site-specific DNA recombinase
MKNAIRYFVYVRKSTDDKTHQVMSLPAQTHELRGFAKREQISICETLEEARSAKVPGRPVLNQMLDRIEAGEANGILCWDIDRLYRNPIDEGRVRWLLQNGIIKSIRTPSRQFLPEDAGLLMGVEGGRATDYIIRLAKNVKRGLDEKLRRGEWPGGNKPLGYLYDHDLRNIVPDPKVSKIVLTMFEEYAAGMHTLDSASERLFKLGIASRSGKPWSKFAVWQFLTNRLYIGVMTWKGETFEGKYKTFISPELFKQVGQVLKNRSKPRKVKNGHNFPFCGLFKCTCGSMMSAQWAKGNGGLYRYYRCTRKVAKCSEPYVQESSVIEQCLALVSPYAITSEQADHLRSLIDAEGAKDTQGLQNVTGDLADGITTVQEKLNKLTKGYLNGLIDEDSYQVAKDELIFQKNALKKEKERLSKTRSTSWNEPAKAMISALEMAGKSQATRSPEELSQVVHKVGTNRLIARKTVSFSLSENYDFLPSLLGFRRIETSNLSLAFSEENLQSPIWCIRQDLNLQPSDPKSEALSN